MKFFKIWLLFMVIIIILGCMCIFMISNSFNSNRIFGDLTQSFKGYDVTSQINKETGEYFGYVNLTETVSEKDIYDNMYNFYKKIGKRNNIQSDVNKVTIIIKGMNGENLMTSILFKDEIRSKDWEGIKTYNELKNEMSIWKKD